MILSEKMVGVSKPARAKGGCTYRHRELLTTAGRALIRSGIYQYLAADMLGISGPTLSVWIGKAIRAEQSAARAKKGDA